MKIPSFMSSCSREVKGKKRLCPNLTVTRENENGSTGSDWEQWFPILRRLSAKTNMCGFKRINTQQKKAADWKLPYCLGYQMIANLFLFNTPPGHSSSTNARYDKGLMTLRKIFLRLLDTCRLSIRNSWNKQHYCLKSVAVDIKGTSVCWPTRHSKSQSLS